VIRISTHLDLKVELVEDQGGMEDTMGVASTTSRLTSPSLKASLIRMSSLIWLQTVERMFDYKDIPDEKKVKLVALKLRKYASI